MAPGRMRIALALAIGLATGPAAGQPAAAATRLLESPECGPARPGCKLPPGVRRQLERQARLEGLRDASGAGAPAPARDAATPRATPEDQIQEAYRGHGTIRPEYRDSGAVLR